MSMSDHIKQQVVQEVFAKKVSFSWKTETLDSLILSELAETANIYSMFWVEAAWHNVLNCCTMCGTQQPREQLQIGDRGSNPVVANQYLMFFLLGPHVLVPFFSFVNIHYFTWLTSFDLILL